VPNHIPVYYMHGYLRFDKRSFWKPKKEAPDVRVLTEQEYYDFVNRPTLIYTYTYLHLLRGHPCMFVGMSLLDDNIRRLLHHSLTERIDGHKREM